MLKVATYSRVGAIGGLLIAVTSVPAVAAPTAGYDGFKVGSYIHIRPALGVRVEYDDNIFRQPDNEESDVVTRISPAFDIQIGADGGVSGLDVQYRPTFGVFQDNSDESVVNHDLDVAYGYRAARFDARVMAGFRVQNEARGTGVSNALSDSTTIVFDEPTRFHEETIGFTLGNIGRGARTRLGIGYEEGDIEYQNFRDITRARDHERRTWTADAGYRIGGATYANVRATVAEVDFEVTPVGLPNLDSDETRIDVGFVWESTGITTSRASIGWQEKDFDDNTVGTTDQFVWDVGFSWQPTDYVTVDVSTDRRFFETNREGTAVSSQAYNLGYRVDVNDRLATTFGVGFSVDEYQDDRREDDVARATFLVEYRFRRWLDLGGGMEFESRDSNQFGADFERNVYFVQARVGL